MLRLLVSISVHHNQVTVVSAVPVTAANLLMDNSRSSHSNSSSKISPIVLVLVKALWALLAKNYIFQLFPPLFFCLLAQLQF